MAFSFLVALTQTTAKWSLISKILMFALVALVFESLSFEPIKVKVTQKGISEHMYVQLIGHEWE